jgi:hypothetical protein
MPLTWADEDFSPDDIDWDEEDTSRAEYTLDDVRRFRHQCRLVNSWRDAASAPASWLWWEGGIAASWSQRWLPDSLLHELRHAAESADMQPRRLWEALEVLGEAIAELDAEPLPPPTDSLTVAVTLDKHLDRLWRLRRLLEHAPSADDLFIDDESEGEIVVDWLALNRAQAARSISGIRSENGSSMEAYRPQSLGSPAVEFEAEDSLFE